MLSGHSTTDALRILHDELKANLDTFLSRKKRRLLEDFGIFNHKSAESVFNWISGVYIVICASLLGIAFLFQEVRDGWVLLQVVILTCFLVTNIFFTSIDHHLKQQEAINKAKCFLSELLESSRFQKWQDGHYIDLNCPISQCISLQWTVRDSKVINLPCSLLVEGDVILLRPGQAVPGNCCSLKSYSRDKETSCRLLKDECYNPPHNFIGIENFSSLSSCLPLQPEPYIMLETPFISQFREFLEKSSLRPCGTLDKEKFNIYSKICERKLIPAIVVVMMIINVLRYFLFYNEVGSLADMLIILQVQSVFPLLALSFPILWKILNFFGSARVLVVFEHLKKSQDYLSVANTTLICKFHFFLEVANKFFLIIAGDSNNLPRTTNIVQTLGNLTSFCCVDKKGILSWPNPSAEKVFFLSNAKNKTGLKTSSSCTSPNTTDTSLNFSKTRKNESGATCQVLNLTQDTKVHDALFFDDHMWKNHISSLKPLGLSILLNTCNLKTTDQYTEFADHVKCVSLKKKEAVPVVNRRCFCELAKQIGFTQQATKIFATEDVYGIYQHDASFSKQTNCNHQEKYKMPMPNMFCVSVRDLSTNTRQLFSQGMADLLLSTCTHYWGGSEICPLGNAERKKIADFYHRTSMTSYCTAFSYRPFNERIPSGGSKYYFEVSENLFSSQRHLETSLLYEDFDEKVVLESGQENIDSISIMSSHDQNPDKDINKIPVKFLGNQIFIGMVAMQYQAKQEVVNLIERLESSCIRFVHFSKENELRSRGFSEKMGLEAGWNCHISLLNEKEDLSSCPDLSFRKNIGPERHQEKFGSAPNLKMNNVGRNTRNPSTVEQIVANSATRGPDIYLSTCKPTLTRKLSLNSSQQANKSKKIKEKKKLSSDIDNPHLQPLIDDIVGNVSQSESLNSSIYSSYIEGFSEIQNRARLPKGIENIRPHINDIDNVPLQVSLFTDCTTSTTCEMLQILQEFGEVTCCLGSSLNIDNPFMFLQSDCSISKEPVYPQICNKQTPFSATKKEEITPMELSSRMQSLPCFLMFQQTDVSCFPHLLTVARKHCQRVRTSARIYISFQLCLTCLQLFNHALFLPPCLSPQLIMWLCLIVVPIFSLSMMGNASYSQVNASVQGKNQKKIFCQAMSLEAACFLARYVPLVLVCIFIHAVNLHHFCSINSNSTSCHVIFGMRRNSSSSVGNWNEWSTTFSNELAMSQHFTALQLVFYFAAISMCNVHCLNYLWKQLPFKNVRWCLVTLILVTVQLIWFFCAFGPHNSHDSHVRSISLVGWLIFASWIFILIIFHELIKKREIKIWIRHQKRARLDFGTKLGMNSPF